MIRACRGLKLRKLVPLALSLLLTVDGSLVLAQPYLPSPGGARGADTGDSGVAFSGLADTPAADLYSGAATTRIPITVPAGRGNATPSLTLQYTSSGGTSPYGYGWTLPIPKILRSTRLGVPAFDDTDTFVISLGHVATDLARIPGTPRYRADPEGSYLRIGLDRAANAWRVVDKSGNTYEFGFVPSARMGPEPSSADGTAVWLLTRSVDPFGNHVDYTYLASDDEADAGLPFTVRYGGNVDAGIAHAFTVAFFWDTPSYPLLGEVSYRGGYPSRVRRRLLAVATYTPDGIARRYGLSHDVDPYTGNARLVAVSLDGFATDPADDTALPSTVFVYSSPSQRDWPIGSESARRAQATVFPSPGGFRDFGDKIDFDTFDIDGDAIVDYVSVVTNPPTVRRGTLQGFGAAQAWQWPVASRRIRKIDSGNDVVINVFDITGDGLPDLVDARASECGNDRWCIYRNTGSGFALTPEVWPSNSNRIRAADVDGRTVRADVADMDGDGRPDLIDASVFTTSYRYWHVYRNHGTGFEPNAIPFSAEKPFISRTATDGDRSFLLYGLHDMNGDGLPDFVRADVNDLGSPLPLSAEHWDVHLNTGTGFSSEPLEWRVEGSTGIRLHNFLSSYNSEPGSRETDTYDELIDINGDGRLDWVRFWSGADLLAFGLDPLPCEDSACSYTGTLVPPDCCFQNLVFVNTGSSFSDPMPWAAWHDTSLRSYSKTPTANTREFDLFDFDGDALLDLVEIEDGEWRVFAHPASPRSRGSATADSRRYRPNLLVAMMNGIGGETRLEYSSVSAMPGNSLPFPTWVVRRQETHDGVTQSAAGSSDFEYRHAAYDAVENESRGFGLVWQTDPLGRVTATEFHQDDARAGLVERVSMLGIAACTSGDPLDSANPCSPWQRIVELRENVWTEAGPVLLASHRATPFHGGVPIAELGKTIDYSYDNFGNVIAESIASSSAGVVVTETTYAHSISDNAAGQPSRYIVDKPLRSMTYDEAAIDAPLVEKRYTYDAPKPNTGALTSARTCIEWNLGSCKRWQTLDYQHDRVGNVVAVRGPNGGSTSLKYDSSRLYAATIRNALGAETLITRDFASGQETRRTLPDGQVLETAYDGLGRPVRHRRTGGSLDTPDIEATYFEGTPDGAPSWVRTITVGGPPVVVFYDGLGRLLATKRWTESESGVKAVVSGFRRYSAAGTIDAESVTFEAQSSVLTALGVSAEDVPAWTEYVRDAHGRLVETRLPDGSRTRHDSSVPGVRVTVNPNLSSGTQVGTARIELLDGFQRVWRKDECGVAPPPGAAGACPTGALLARSEYEYDGLDRATRITTAVQSPNPAVTTTRYDGLGNRVEHSSSDLGRWFYAYDEAGLLVEAIDPRGSTVSNFYDKLGRLHRQVTDDSRSAFKYHRRGFGTGLVRRVSARSGATRVRKDLAYDARGRVASESWRVRAEDRTRDHEVEYGYDDADRRTSVSYPGRIRGTTDVLRTEYTPYGLPFASWLEASDGRTDLVHAVSYDIQGSVTRVDYGNGWSDRFTYTAAYDLSRLRCTRTAPYLAAGTACNGGTSDLRRYRVSTRDPAGNVLGVVDSRHAGTPHDRSVDLTYDALGRLLESRVPGGAIERFAYDATGNLTQIGALGSLTYGSDSPHLAVSVSGTAFTHDAAGNRTGKGAWAYAYDALGRLSEVSDGGVIVSRNHYDEGRSRVAKYDAQSDDVTFYFGGLVEVGEHSTTRLFHFMDRVIAADVIDPSETSASGAAPLERNVAGLVSFGTIHACAILALLVLAATRFSRAGTSIVTIIVFLTSVTAAPALVSRGSNSRQEPRSSASPLMFVHVDERLSPELLTDASGSLVERRSYSSYGRLKGAFDAGGQPVAEETTAIAFNGHIADRDAGLVYFGSRYYDPELGLFLTPDPQAQYASPYLYGGGNPVYGVDPDGEALFAFLAAILQPIVASAVATSFVSAVAAAAQGGDVAGALVDGFVSGAAGAALGTALASANVTFQYVVGGADFIEFGEALGAAIEAAHRAAFTNAVSHAAATTSRAVDLDSDWATVVDFGVKLLGSYVYDNLIIRDSGTGFGSAATQRAVAKNGMRQVNTTTGHTTVTEEAALGTGWENQSAMLAKANVAQDGAGGLLARTGSVLNNQAHFGRLPATASKIQAELDGLIGGNASKLLGVGPGGASSAFGRALGAASHYVQDHLTLGHMVPGTALFAGPVGAPVRFVIHQVFGGEIAFRNAQVRATRALLSQYGAPA
jgi:RHS repeat-associated protein